MHCPLPDGFSRSETLGHVLSTSRRGVSLSETLGHGLKSSGKGLAPLEESCMYFRKLHVHQNFPEPELQEKTVGETTAIMASAEGILSDRKATGT